MGAVYVYAKTKEKYMYRPSEKNLLKGAKKY